VFFCPARVPLHLSQAGGREYFHLNELNTPTRASNAACGTLADEIDELLGQSGHAIETLRRRQSIRRPICVNSRLPLRTSKTSRQRSGPRSWKARWWLAIAASRPFGNEVRRQRMSCASHWAIGEDDGAERRAVQSQGLTLKARAAGHSTQSATGQFEARPSRLFFVSAPESHPRQAPIPAPR
jgi:hypothetical protein